MGIFPAVDPLASSSRILTPEILGEEHYKVAQGVKHILQRYKELLDIIAILGMDELSDEDKLTYTCASSPTCSCLSRFTLLSRSTVSQVYMYH